MHNAHKILAAAMSALLLTTMAGCEDISSSSSVAESSVATTEADADTTLSSEQGTEDSSSASAPDGTLAFSCTMNGTEIKIDAECDPIIAALGEPKETFEAPSCAFDGTSYTYTYDGFTVETYPDNGVNRVYAVTLTDNTRKTAEGAAVGMTADEIKNICGAPVVESDAFLVYKGEGVDLQFFLKDGAVYSIVYTYHVG